MLGYKLIVIDLYTMYLFLEHLERSQVEHGLLLLDVILEVVGKVLAAGLQAVDLNVDLTKNKT